MAFRTNPISLPRTARPNIKPATSIHPAVTIIPAAAAAWLVAGAWVVFGGKDTSTVLFMATIVLVMYAGLMLSGGAFARDVTSADRARARCFRDFIKGRVVTFTGVLSGRQALAEIAILPVLLAVGGTAILAVAALTGF